MPRTFTDKRKQRTYDAYLAKGDNMPLRGDGEQAIFCKARAGMTMRQCLITRSSPAYPAWCAGHDLYMRREA